MPGKDIGTSGNRTRLLIILLCAVTALLVLLIVITAVVIKGDKDHNSTTAEGESGSGKDEGGNTVPKTRAVSTGPDSEMTELIIETEKYLEEVLPSDGAEDEYGPAELGAVYAKASEGVNEYYNNFLKLEGVNANLYDAGHEYFVMLTSYLSEYAGVSTFYAEVKELYDSINVWDWSIYDGPAEFYEKTNAHIKELKERYDAIECPKCLESPWSSIGDYFEHMDEAYYRLCLGVEMDDHMRMYSGMNILDHIDIIRDRRFRDMYDIIDEVTKLNTIQEEKCNALYGEIINAASLPDEERAAYVFKNTFKDDILINYDAIETIYPSLYNSYDRILIIEMGCISGQKDAVVSVEIPGLTETYSQSIKVDPTISALCIKIPVDTGADVDKPRDAQMKVSIANKDGSLIEAQTFPVHIKGKNDFDWISDEFGVTTKDNILCFLQPDSAAIAKLKRSAIDYLEAMSGGDMQGIVGYQGPFFNSTYVQAAALMCAMSDMGVRYNMDGFSIDGSNQYILLPDEVLERKSGLCIETSLVIASALQSAGMHTMIVIPEGHAQVAVETWKGSGEYFLIETTSLPANINDFVEYANYLAKDTAPKDSKCPITYLRYEDWDKYINKTNAYIIDCSDGVFLGLTPFVH